MIDAHIRFALGESTPVLSVSDGIEALLGYRPEQFLSGAVTFEDRIHRHDRDIADRLFAADLEPPRGGFNLRLRQANGRIRCVQGDYTKTIGAAGEVFLDLCLRDAKSLAARRDDSAIAANLRAMLENTDDFIYFKDRNHVFTGASQTLVALTDPAERWTDLLGQTDYDVFPEAYADIYYRLEKQVFAGAAVAHEVQESLTKDGRKGWVDNRKYPIRDDHGDIVGLFGIARDITEQKRVEDVLRESEAFKHNILDSISAQIAVLDPDGRIVMVNEAWRRFAMENSNEPGKPARNTQVGINYLNVCRSGPEDAPCEARDALEGIRGVLEGQRPSFNLEYPCHAPNRPRWFSMSVTPLWEAHRGVVITHTDITERKLVEQALRESEESLSASQRIAGLGSYVLELPGGTWRSSAVLDGLLGIDADYEHTVAGWEALIHPDDRTAMADYLQNQVLEQGKAFDKEYRIVRRSDRATRWVHGMGRLELDDRGRVLKMRGTIQDITERKLAEDKLRLAASVFTHAREGIMITAADGTIVEVNDTFSQLTGYDRDEAIGRKPSLLKSDRHPAEFYARMWRGLIEQGHWYGEIWNRHKNGAVYAEMLAIGAVKDDRGETRNYVALLSDITAIKEHERQLEHIAHYDALTGLPNRVLLADRLHQAMAQSQRRGQRLAVAYLDLDGFKVVNDRHGHDAGDALLTAVATRMRLALREGDTLARLGGDEFVAVLLDLADVAAGAPMLHRLLAAAAEPARVGELTLQVSASIGVTFYPQADEVDADQLLRQADQAMYQAKLAGKNRFHLFDAEQDRSLRGHHESLEHIRRALDGREFVLHYQPKVNMRTGAVVGAEALIRWQHPERGLLPPALFLPVIEDHPLAVELGEWVIDTALAQMSAWRAAGYDIPVSVNVGARQLQQADFVARLHILLAAHPDIEPSMLELEVLETSALQDVAHVSQVLDACRGLGVHFALDDFGTGYSSLTYLKRLPARVLKIDQSFVRDMLDDPEDLAILEGVLGLATAFRRQAIAEGVETVAHGAMLLRLGCELAQGYGIARPMPADDIPGWSGAWRPDAAWVEAAVVGADVLPLLYAGVECRAWVVAIEAVLKGERTAPPPLDHRQCRFGMWLEDERLAGRGERPGYPDVVALHCRIHALGAELCAAHAEGRDPEGPGRLDELCRLRDSLLERLTTLYA